MNIIQQIQSIIGVNPDGIWGPISQSALISSDDATKEKVQALLSVFPDGQWGPISQAALNAARGASSDFKPTHFSSFADPADVAAFKKCKLTGKSDVQCFAVGDNGIGEFGQVTAQDTVPMVAVNAAEMKARWGSISGAAHRMVLIKTDGEPIEARVEDRISAPGRVDLNPAAAKALGLNPPFVVPGQWKWKDV